MLPLQRLQSVEGPVAAGLHAEMRSELAVRSELGNHDPAVFRRHRSSNRALSPDRRAAVCHPTFDQILLPANQRTKLHRLWHPAGVGEAVHVPA